MGAGKKDPGVLLRLPQELHDRVAAWSSETGRTVHEILLDAIQRSLMARPANSPEREELLQENESLKKRLESLQEALRSYYPEERAAPKITPRRVSPEEQKRALEEAQQRLALLRSQKKAQPVQLPSTKTRDVARLQELEAELPQVAAEMLSPKSAMMTQKRALAQRGRIEGVAYEESEDLQARAPRREVVTRPTHVKEPLQKKAEELVRAQRQATTRTEPTPQGHARKKS